MKIRLKVTTVEEFEIDYDEYLGTDIPKTHEFAVNELEEAINNIGLRPFQTNKKESNTTIELDGEEIIH